MNHRQRVVSFFRGSSHASAHGAGRVGAREACCRGLSHDEVCANTSLLAKSPAASWPGATQRVVVAPLLGMLALAVGTIDGVTGIEVSVEIFYLLPVGVAAWLLGRSASLMLAVLCACLWCAADVIDGHTYAHPWMQIWNAVSLFLFLCTTGWSLSAVSKSLAREKKHARVDHLTGLWNARAFYELAEKEAQRAQRQHSPVTIGYLDLDDFKAINDSVGHLKADELLVHVGDALRRTVRQGDVVGRLGGDEFAIILAGAPACEARLVLQRVHDAVTRATGGAGFAVTFSMGALCVRQVQGSVESLLQEADRAMYDAKLAGKNTFVLYDSQVRTTAEGSASDDNPQPYYIAHEAAQSDTV